MPPNPETVAKLQRRFTGLDDELHYVAGHTIDNKYQAYKAADEAAGAASKMYKNTAKELRPKKPYTGPLNHAGEAKYYAAGHATLAPLAGSAADTAAYHADRRDSFNNRYKDLLKATEPENYTGHVRQYDLARKSATKYYGYQSDHQKYMH